MYYHTKISHYDYRNGLRQGYSVSNTDGEVTRCFLMSQDSECPCTYGPHGQYAGFAHVPDFRGEREERFSVCTEHAESFENSIFRVVRAT